MTTNTAGLPGIHVHIRTLAAGDHDTLTTIMSGMSLRSRVARYHTGKVARVLMQLAQCRNLIGTTGPQSDVVSTSCGAGASSQGCTPGTCPDNYYFHST